MLNKLNIEEQIQANIDTDPLGMGFEVGYIHVSQDRVQWWTLSDTVFK
jgi:hypothetical protein